MVSSSRINNLESLMLDMQRKHWHNTPFSFSYNRVNTTVLVEDRHCFKPSENYVLARFTFYDNDSPSNVLCSEVTHFRLQVKPRDIRKFFHIPYAEDFGDFTIPFYNSLNKAIPPFFRENLSKEEDSVVNQRLFQGDRNDGTCVFAVKHNHNNGQRTPFNDDKAKKFCPDVYAEYYKDTNISFCFRKENPVPLALIRERLGENH